MARRGIAVVPLALALAGLVGCGEPGDPIAAPSTPPRSSSPVEPTRVRPATSIAPPSTAAAPPPSTAAAPLPSTGGRPATTAPAPAPPAPATFPSCAAVADVAAPASWYRDTPVYTGNEQPVEDVRAWARSRPGYEDIWVDRDHHGWIVVGFSGDAAARQAELEAEFPDVGVVAVEVPTSQAALATLQRDVNAALSEAGVESWATGGANAKWVVEVAVSALDDAVVEALAPFAGERICLDGPDPADTVPARPRPGAGAGWRLLGDEVVGHPYRTGVATNDAQYARLWDRVGMTGRRPVVDFGPEVVVWFGAVYGSGCPIRLDDVVIDAGHEPALLHAVTVVPGSPVACNGDANPHAFFVAVPRDRLPAGPLAIQLGPNDPPAGGSAERTLVTADLSAPGAVATADQVGPDPALVDAADEPHPVESGGVIESGYPWRYRMYAYCGVAVLGQLNGIWWMTPERGVPVPAPWRDLVDPADHTLIVDVVMTEGPAPTLTATANGHAVTYRPVPADEVPPCD